MWKVILAGTTALTIAGASLAIAQEIPDRGNSQRWRPSAEDRSAFTDAQLAELKAGLRLTPSQEKYWPDLEAVLRDRAKQRAAEQKLLADVVEPLYNSLDEGQKQRFAMLFRAEGERRPTLGFRDRDQMGSDRQTGRGPQGPYRERSTRSQREIDDDQMESDRQARRDPQGPYRERSTRSQREIDDHQMESDSQARRGPQRPNSEGSARRQRQIEDEDQMGSDRQMNRDPQGPYRDRSSRGRRRMDDQMGSDRQARRGPQWPNREGSTRSQRRIDDDL
jgi:zinc resistance-associated protein